MREYDLEIDESYHWFVLLMLFVVVKFVRLFSGVARLILRVIYPLMYGEPYHK